MVGYARICIAGTVLALILVPASRATGQNVETKVNPQQDFSKLHSYSWKENRVAPGQVPQERARIDRMIQDVVNREMAKKGYAEDPQNPDFFIEVGAAALPGSTATSANPDLRVPAQSDAMVYSSRMPGVNIWMTLVARARIIVTDRISNTTAWEANVTKNYKNPDKLTNNLEKEIDSVFKKALKDFPRHNK